MHLASNDGPSPESTRLVNRILAGYSGTWTLARGLRGFANLVFSVAVLCTAAAALGLFRFVAPIILIGISFALVAALVSIVGKRMDVSGDRFDAIALTTSILAALLVLFLRHEFFQAQFDVGFYANDANLIAQTGGRIVNGPYDHLLPGFGPTSHGYEVQAMFGYSSLTALFAYIGGYGATGLVNVPLAVIPGTALYLIGRDFDARWGAIAAQLLYQTSLLTLWFNRWVMTENAAAAAFWVAAWLVLRLWRSWDKRDALALLLAAAFLAVVRPEGFLVAGWLLLLAVGSMWSRRGMSVSEIARSLRGRRSASLVSLALGLFFLIMILVARIPEGYVGANLDIAKETLNGRIGVDVSDVPVSGPHPNWGDYTFRYEWESAQQYQLQWLLLATTVGLALGTLQRRRFLLLLAAALPFFYFVLMPPVTTYHPWYMRRLWVVWIPLFMLGAGVALDPQRMTARLSKRLPKLARMDTPKYVSVAVVGVLLLLQVDTSAPLAFQSENDGSQALSAAVARALPSGAVIILDEDIDAYASQLRFEHGFDVIPFQKNRASSLLHSISAASGAQVFILKTNSSFPRPELLPLDVTQDTRFGFSVQFIPRVDHRAYLREPPLEDGYEPLAAYLRAGVPPNRMVQLDLEAQLLEPGLPLIIRKATVFENDTWTLEDGGLRANPTAGVHLEWNRYSASDRSGLAFVLFVVRHQGEPVRPIELVSDNSTTTVDGVAVENRDAYRLDSYSISRGSFPEIARFAENDVVQATYLGPQQ